MIEAERIQRLNQRPAAPGRYVLYWMQQSQREAHNPALEISVAEANRRYQSVVVLFVLMERYAQANERHFAFMLQGLREVAVALRRRGIAFAVRRGEATDVVLELARDASMLICDRGYLRNQRAWRTALARQAPCPVVQVEGDVVVPVDEVTDKAEYAARTIRPKILKKRDMYLRSLTRVRINHASMKIQPACDFDPLDPAKTLSMLDIDRSVGESTHFLGGTSEARKRLRTFRNRGLVDYSQAKNDPAEPRCSGLSPYLHFGQISPVEAALKVARTENCAVADREAFLEQLIVRRELAINYVLHQPRYDKYAALPEWTRRTLREHGDDARPFQYTLRALESAATHDPYWNAAMKEMVKTGYMHNYMRMYWGKKVIEWSATPERAYRHILTLNNKYFIDGRDPNSFTSVAWLFGLHDRPWTERAVFGKIRYMNAAGLERKFDIRRYVEWVDNLAF
jgi:deoxyribodipyrimidine photo-lyase